MTGLTLVELMIGIALLAMLLSLGAPSFATWSHNAQIRAMADSIVSGLQLAQSDAARRNQTARFQLVSSLDNSCVLTTSGSNWVVSLQAVAGACASNNMADATDTAPGIVERRPAAESTPSAAVSASQSSIAFTGLGRVSPVPAGNITIDVSNPSGGTCVASGGAMRCLRIVVSPQGQVRMCDPHAASGDPRAC
jgi:type IV fimbrial biogenesis protein FimT